MQDLEKIKYLGKEKIILCIGTCNVIGDSIGPRVGTLLKKMDLKNTTIIGDIQNNINANNVIEIVKNYNLKDKYTIVIDSALGNKKLVGKIFISYNKLILGKALYKNIGNIGDVSIKACVCENLYNPIKNYYELKKVDINLIYKLTQEIINVLK